MRRRLLVLGAVAVLAACASADSVKQAQGKGVKQTFRHPYDAVYQAALNSAARRKLEVIEQDRAAGRLVLSGKGSWTSFGEYIAVFVTRGGERTDVEIVSRPVGGPVTFPPEWPSLMLGDIDQELTPRRPK